MYNRNNQQMATAVEQGIVVDSLKGAANAWAHMAAAHVPRRVILRVLTDTSRRRPGDIAGSPNCAEEPASDSHPSKY